jgi:O-antigen ligase
MGLGTFGVQYQKLLRPDSDTNANPHSTYGMLYAEQGLVGMSLYITVIGYLWYRSIKSVKRCINEILHMRKNEKKISRELYLTYGAKLFLILLTFGVPFFSIATITYYGFFLPMTWWWGNGELV